MPFKRGRSSPSSLYTTEVSPCVIKSDAHLETCGSRHVGVYAKDKMAEGDRKLNNSRLCFGVRDLGIRDQRYDADHVIRPLKIPKGEIDKRLPNIKTFGVPGFCAVKMFFF